MSRSGSMSQLLKGIFIGIVLIMAIIGTMSLLENGNPITSFLSKHAPETTTASNNTNIKPPSITVNNDTQTINQNRDTTNIGDLTAQLPDEPLSDTPNEEVADGTTPDEKTSVTNSSEDENENKPADKPEEAANIIKPTLEGEKTPEETKPEIVYGTMSINSINTNDNTDIKVNYAVYDQDNVKVMESNDVNEATYRLPIGQYKVEAILNKVDKTTKKVSPIATKNRYMIVKEEINSRYTFELEPPSNIGVLQVSAKILDKNIKANFVVQTNEGQVIASRNNVSSSIFQLDSGTYKVTVTKDNNTDFKSVEIKGGESLQTVFNLKQSSQQGKLLVKLLGKGSNTPLRGDILITAQDNTVVQELKASTEAELSLSQGNYKIKVTGPNGVSNKNIRVLPGQILNEVFRFDVPDTNTIVQIDEPGNTGPNSTTIINAVEPENNDPETNQPESSEPEVTESDINNNGKASLSIFAQDNNTRQPLRSNIYIQTPQGRHIENKTYVESATFNLDPGTYKVTVRATNRENLVKTIKVNGNKKISQTFSLIDPSNPRRAPQNSAPQNTTPENTAIRNVEVRRPSDNTEIRRPADNTDTRRLAPENIEIRRPPANQPNTIETGFLNISMQAPRNQRADLSSNFIVNTTSGQKIAELSRVSNGNLKLDAGTYDVIAIYQNQQRSQRINIRANQNTRLVFRTTDFQTPTRTTLAKGVLRSRIVSQSGQALTGTLIVRNTLGQVVAQRNNVSSAVFELPPTRHSIHLNYQGLTASEEIKINLNETTVQTFTIATN